MEKEPDSTDPNPFRYCGEYFDKETGTYYLRARYYSPETGRFTQEDTHWNPANRLYGDEPQKINERTDKLGLKTYAYAPDITAVMQSGNLYAYCLNSPNDYLDESGKMAVAIVSCSLLGVICAFLGVAVGGHALAVLIEKQWDSLCTALWLKPSWKKSLIQMAEETEKDVEADTGNQEESKKSFPTQSEEKTFPEDPDDFNPDGLTRKEFQTSNGKVIKWFNEDGQAVYEWDEDLSHGSHYHILDENGRTRIPGPNGNTHRYPGERY